jgi:hypothetical protein
MSRPTPNPILSFNLIQSQIPNNKERNISSHTTARVRLNLVIVVVFVFVIVFVLVFVPCLCHLSSSFVFVLLSCLCLLYLSLSLFLSLFFIVVTFVYYRCLLEFDAPFLLTEFQRHGISLPEDWLFLDSLKVYSLCFGINFDLVSIFEIVNTSSLVFFTFILVVFLSLRFLHVCIGVKTILQGSFTFGCPW